MNSSNMLLSFDRSSTTRNIHSCESTDSSNSSDSFSLLAASDPQLQALFLPPGGGATNTATSTDVQLEVSDNSFVLNSNDFQKLAALPWKPIHSDSSAFRLDGVSADAFQKCIDYVVFEVLPKKKKMSEQEKQEVRSMASTAKLVGLLDHMAGKSSKPTRRGSKQQPLKSTTTGKTMSEPRRKKFLGGWFGSSNTKKGHM